MNKKTAIQGASVLTLDKSLEGLTEPSSTVTAYRGDILERQIPRGQTLRPALQSSPPDRADRPCADGTQQDLWYRAPTQKLVEASISQLYLAGDGGVGITSQESDKG